MKLKVLIPNEILIDEPVSKVVAEATNGSFCLLPRHLDWVAPLAAGILAFVPKGQESEVFLAVDEGILIKVDDEVLVSCLDAVMGPELHRLRQVVDERFKRLDNQERRSRNTVAKLEAGFIRRFLDIQKYG
ncbi:F0F1 ATP synthase subunit epsilon [Desulfofustis glycolicus]|uniref:F-type H+-transporting ATPase subunit epsilon n=1 Tax=Desulfofustis glycolicus DSM 9705 TaxID=1121409 RepID=A0A1M5SJ88_9BACT|nr:F0F1 ATP synthase subunit epsilon [Desulfofustis glycolicus]MCB2215781.1 F0F1 ATP synthase subunit epsilon [Desulfobulbaceae bacterium]SHH38525.1 F-type H+-transporting ATPase subunit epsilon [Desulfofustis glycolicus DSM 9705]